MNRILVIARDKKCESYVCYDLYSNKTRLFNKNNFKYLLSDVGAINYELHGNEIVYTQGSEERLPKIGEPGIFILDKKVKNNFNFFRYVYSNGYAGELKEYTSELHIMCLINRGIRLINGKEVTRNNSSYISFIKGRIDTTYIDTIQKEKEKAKRRQREMPLDKLKSQSREGLALRQLEEDKLLREYSKKDIKDLCSQYGDTKEIKEIEKKSRGRFGSKIKRALIVGLVVTQIGGMLTGCGYEPKDGHERLTNSTTTSSSINIDNSEIKSPIYNDINLKLSEAKEINFDIEFMSLGYKGSIYADDAEVAKVEGKWLKLLDKLDLYDLDGYSLGKSEENLELISKETWVIKDTDGNILYRMKGKFSLLGKYELQDKDGNTIAIIKTDLSMTRNGTIYDTNDKEMYKITGNLMSKDLKITKSSESNEELDGITLALIGTSYMSEAQRQKSSHNHSNKNK